MDTFKSYNRLTMGFNTSSLRQMSREASKPLQMPFSDQSWVWHTKQAPASGNDSYFPFQVPWVTGGTGVPGRALGIPLLLMVNGEGSPECLPAARHFATDFSILRALSSYIPAHLKVRYMAAWSSSRAGQGPLTETSFTSATTPIFPASCLPWTCWELIFSLSRKWLFGFLFYFFTFWQNYLDKRKQNKNNISTQLGCYSSLLVLL